MDISIKEGSLQYLNDCEEALVNSELGRRYFASEGFAKKVIQEGLEQGNLYIAMNSDVCVGFVWYIPKGAFGFPYINMISIKEEYRGKGIGKKIFNILEESFCRDANKMFLVVADFNPDAKRFYERLGYRKVGEIPNLYKNGITEYVMMKEKEKGLSEINL